MLVVEANTGDGETAFAGELAKTMPDQNSKGRARSISAGFRTSLAALVKELNARRLGPHKLYRVSWNLET